MAPPAGTLRVGRYFLVLFAILVILYGIVFWPGSSNTPKLGLDLEGGTQVVFKARTPDGKTPPSSSMTEAQTIMTSRVNGFGVSNAQVVIEGNNQISISVPGKNSKDLQNIGSAAVLNFRPLVMAPVATQARQNAAISQVVGSAAPSVSGSGSAGVSPSGSVSPSSPGTAASSAPSSPAPSSSAPSSTSKATTQDYRDQPIQAPASSPAAAPSATAPAVSTTPSGAAVASPTPNAASSAAAQASAASSAANTPVTDYCLTPPAQVLPAQLKTCADPLKNLISTVKATDPKFAVPTTEADYNTLTTAQPTEQSALLSAVGQFDCGAKPADTAAAKYLLACDANDPKTATQVYLLGPIVVPGTEIASAAAIAPGSSQGQTQWVVSLSLKSSGSTAWAKWTAAHNTAGQAPTGQIATCGPSGTPCADYVAFTLDNAVINAPYTAGTINGDTQISGGQFTQSTATTLANELRYGALPLSFDLQTNTTISATLGSGQLKAGLLAGGIGLVLVVIYSLLYYRALGLVTIASLLVSGGLTYAALVVLGRDIGFTLTLAGIAGFIVAVGITADSFVVFFERIKDEVHEGRSMRVAVPRAWVRARRTIISADIVSFLAAAVLYEFAAGDVRGFAFTLGLSTILDLVVVFLFTHPLVSLLSRSAAFGSARFTGLDAAREGGINPPSGRDVMPSRAAKAKRAGAPPKAAQSSVAVLEVETAEPEDELADAIMPAEPDIDDDAEPADFGEDPAGPGAKTTPEPGSAAERAAARRARLRTQELRTQELRTQKDGGAN